MSFLTFTTRRPGCKKNKFWAKDGRIIKHRDTVNDEEMISMLARKAMQDFNWEAEYKGPVTLEIIYFKEDDRVQIILKKAPAIFGDEVKRRFDLQNLADTLCDGLEKSGAIANDKQIVRITIRELAPKKKP